MRPPSLQRLATVALVGLAVLGLSVGPVAAQSEEPTEDPVPREPLRLTMVERPAWVGPDDAVPFRFRIEGTRQGAGIVIRVHEPVDDLGALERSRDQDVGRVRFRTPPVPVDPIGDQTVALKTSSQPDDDPFTATLASPGVHPVVFDLVDAEGTVQDTVRTTVARLGTEDDPLVAPDLVVVVDVSLPPTLAPDGTRALPPGALDDLTPVTELLASHPALPMVVAATPDTVDALAGARDAAALNLLDAMASRGLVALPYLPLSIEAVRTNLLTGLVPEAMTRGRAVLAEIPGAEVIDGLWDPVERIGPADAEVLSQIGADRLLAPAVDRSDEAATWQPMGPFPAGGLDALTAVVVETELSARLAAPADTGIEAPHDLLAELLLRTDADGDVLVVRPGTLAPDSALASLASLLDAPGAPVAVVDGSVLVRTPVVTDADGDRAEPVTLSFPTAPRPDLSAVAADVVAAQAELDTLVSLFGERSARPDTLDLELLTAIAATTPDDARADLVDAVTERIDAAFASVTLAGETDLNLTSRQGTLPVTVANSNDVAVDVLLRIRSDRLAFPQGEILAVTVAAGGERIDVEVEALATGSVPVFVELWTADDKRMLDNRRLDVRSTAISGAGLAISLGALAVLGIWWFRSWRRTRS